ncbi:plasmid pRiA4b ORF-3 family protein [Acetobacterium tundrae]|uniref:Plasmid pRiA4b Orf3-like domain-containing protein n=1 Tax=Acetobacterium tundrae TaxID=132932 RepID=A0ABR6WNX8_9FIRM|nr:plasmid pRiA4b ORF-3 family protein [Acetobacterium tundrae]MBC3798049.1 hypothetical protein [Acetobacterium tundrae]
MIDISFVNKYAFSFSLYLPEYQQLRYTYDMGDNWEHEIRLLRVIEDFDMESPYLLEASGQTPPENAFNKNGFTYCGLIYLKSGAERVAYQRVGKS